MEIKTRTKLKLMDIDNIDIKYILYMQHSSSLPLKFLFGVFAKLAKAERIFKNIRSFNECFYFT